MFRNYTKIADYEKDDLIKRLKQCESAQTLQSLKNTAKGIFTCKSRFRYSRERAVQNLPIPRYLPTYPLRVHDSAYADALRNRALPPADDPERHLVSSIDELLLVRRALDRAENGVYFLPILCRFIRALLAFPLAFGEVRVDRRERVLR